MKRFCVVVLILVAACLARPDELPAPQGFSLDRFYRFPLINGRSPAGATMSPDGTKIVFGWNRTGERVLDVWMMDFPSGKTTEVLKASKLGRPPRQDDKRTDLEKKEEVQYDGGIGNFRWSPDSKEVLFSYHSRSWLMRPDGSDLRPLIDTNEQVSSAAYSPDGQWIAFIRGANVFKIHRASGLLRQLTFLSEPNTGVTEFYWSPDSKNIAVVWENTSKLGSHVMMDFSQDRAKVVNIRRMWQGEKSVDVQVGVVPADGGIIRFVGGIPRYSWIAGVEWAPSATQLAIGAYSEDFQKYTIWVVPITTLRKATAYEETAPKNYLPDWRPMVWTRDSKAIVFGTDVKDGQFTFRSVYRVPAAGGAVQTIYAENHDVVSLSRPKDSDRIFLVTMARSPLTTEITIIEPDGKRTVHVPVPDGFATDKQFDDCSPPLVSDDGHKVASLGNSRTLPRELFSIEPEMKRLTVSPGKDFERVKWAEFTPVSFSGPEGRTIHGVLITKPGLDKAIKHPAFISSMYANSAKLSWNGYFENYAAMELDMVVLQVDFAASWGYGGAFNSSYYKKMGLIDADQAVAAKNYLVSLGYVDPDRVGCWGWSYGGFLTCMIMLTKPDAFKAGVAVASVTDWKSYNEWYTRRRLGMASDEKEVYEKTSPITYPDGLKGDLLLIHGMLDDNVLFQDTARLMQRLIEKEKHFDLMLYPRDDHGIGKDESRPHVFVTVMRYLWNHLRKE